MKPGDLIAGKYRLVRQIGEGAMGVVWSAINEGTTREVALKLVLRSTDDLRHRLLREARACGKLSHRNIIEVHDVGQTEGGDPFLVMQLLSGETVAELLDRQRRLDPSLAAQIGRDVARALATAHAAQIIHRDLKPANIFLHKEPGTEGTVVKVLDFGVCKNLDAVDSVATVVGGLVGSPAFMSPEQVRMVPDLDHRTDIWSLGVTLFKMLTGVLPFQGTAQEVIQKILAGEIPVVSRLVRFVDPGLVQVVSRCLERDRNRRIQSAAELAELLQPYASSEASRVFMELPQPRTVSSPSMQAVSSPAQTPAGAAVYARSRSSAAIPSVVPVEEPDDDAETFRFNPAMAAGLARPREGQAAPVQVTPDRRSQADASPPAIAAAPPAAFSAPPGSAPAVAPQAMPQPMVPTQKLPPDSPWSAPPAGAPHGGLGGTAPLRIPAGATPLPERARDSGNRPRGGTVKMVAPTPAELAAALPRRDSATTTAAVVQSAAASRAAYSGAGGAQSDASGDRGRQWRMAVAIAVISMLVTVSGGLIYAFFISRPNASSTGAVEPTAKAPDAVAVSPPRAESAAVAPAPPGEPLTPPDTSSGAPPVAPPSGAIAAGAPGVSAPPALVAGPMTPASPAPGHQWPNRAPMPAAALAPDAPAILHFSSDPSSRVVLDNKLLGETPLRGIRVSPGEHKVRFVHHERGSRSMGVVLRPGESKTLSVKF